VLRRLLLANSRSIQRLEQAMARADKAQGLDQLRRDTADRRTRTRLLIELGGLVVKAGLHERVDDDRATLLGGLLLLDDLLRGVDAEGPSPADLRARWRRRGLRAFDASAAAATAVKGGKREQDTQPKS